jgi:membrane associated rhomboid family serine protease
MINMKTNAVRTLIIANVAVYVCQYLSRGNLDLWFALWPLQPVDGEPGFHVWQIVTYAFLHSRTDFSHLLFNMLGLWIFGAQVERCVGSRRLLACYFASVIAAALSQLFVPALLGTEPEATIGASGGVFGLLLAYGYLFSRHKVIPLILPIPMPAWLFAALYAGAELVLGVTGWQASVAHFAHIGGMIGSACVVWQWRRFRQ